MYISYVSRISKSDTTYVRVFFPQPEIKCGEMLYAYYILVFSLHGNPVITNHSEGIENS